MNRLELVVARHREDLGWIRRVPHAFAVTVYDKGGGAGGAVSLPNVGREAHSYLYHIANRYEHLADLTVFAQGRPFDHAPEFHRTLRDLASGRRGVRDFRWFGFVIDWDDRSGSNLFRHFASEHEGCCLAMESFWTSLFGESPPDRFVFYPGGQFAVTARAIRTRPVSFYEHALELSVSAPNAGHCFERCWDRVFGVNGIPESLRGLELPIYFRPIRRLGLTWADVAPFRRWNGDPPVPGGGGCVVGDR